MRPVGCLFESGSIECAVERKVAELEASDPENAGFTKLRTDLEEVIRLTKGLVSQGHKNKEAPDRGGGGGAFSIVARVGHLTIDHASLSSRSTWST